MSRESGSPTVACCQDVLGSRILKLDITYATSPLQSKPCLGELDPRRYRIPSWRRANETIESLSASAEALQRAKGLRARGTESLGAAGAALACAFAEEAQRLPAKQQMEKIFVIRVAERPFRMNETTYAWGRIPATLLVIHKYLFTCRGWSSARPPGAAGPGWGASEWRSPRPLSRPVPSRWGRPW